VQDLLLCTKHVFVAAMAATDASALNFEVATSLGRAASAHRPAVRCAADVVGYIHSSTSGGVALGLSGMSAMRPRSGSVATGFVDGLHDIAEADRDFDNRGFGACDIVS
jgi:hypothetical protein